MTGRLLLAALGACALSLPAFAATSDAPAADTDKPASHHMTHHAAHHALMHGGAHTMHANPDTSADALNGQSLTATRAGTTYTPSTGAGGGPAPAAGGATGAGSAMPPSGTNGGGGK